MRYGGGGNSLLASESTAKDLSDSTTKAIDSNLTDLSANHNKTDSKDLSVKHNSDSKDSTANLRKDSIDSSANRSTNPKDSSVNYGRLDSADSATTYGKDSTMNLSKDSIQNINKNIILAQNDSTNPSATNQNSSDSNAESKADSTRISLTHTYDLGRIERTIKAHADYNDSAVFITSEEIEATNSNNIAEALRYQTGVFYYPASGSRGEPSINIRGFGGTQIGFF